MSVHSSAAQGFQAGAATYQRGRPDYPAAVDGWLRDTLGLKPHQVVLDLGAGTGKFTIRLVQTGAQVIAVGPVEAMRAQLAAALPEVSALGNTAEAIPVPNGSVDVVVCAQAFHWFATPAALYDIHRVLRPGGQLALIWNVRDETVPWVQRLGAIVDAYEGDTPRYRSGQWRQLFPFPGFGPLEETRFAYAHTGPAEQVIVDRVLSTSFIAALPAAEQATLATRIRTLIAAEPLLADKPEVTYPYNTAAFTMRRL